MLTPFLSLLLPSRAFCRRGGLEGRRRAAGVILVLRQSLRRAQEGFNKSTWFLCVFVLGRGKGGFASKRISFLIQFRKGKRKA